MIYFISPLSSGNAVKLLLQPPVAATKWRVLRKATNNFTGYNDPAAFVAHEGTERTLIDHAGIDNGAVVYYRVYYFIANAWDGSAPVKSVTPQSIFVDQSVDSLSIVRDRVDLGLQSLVARGVVTANNGHIPVLNAAPQFEHVKFPLVTVHLKSDASEERGIGDTMDSDIFDGDIGSWEETTGYFSRTMLEIGCWCLNGDERKALRAAVKSVLLANFELFQYEGMMNINLQFSDVEDFESYPAPVYQVISTLTCLAPSAVGAAVPVLHNSITVQGVFNG